MSQPGWRNKGECKSIGASTHKSLHNTAAHIRQLQCQNMSGWRTLRDVDNLNVHYYMWIHYYNIVEPWPALSCGRRLNYCIFYRDILIPERPHLQASSFMGSWLHHYEFASPYKEVWKCTVYNAKGKVCQF